MLHLQLQVTENEELQCDPVTVHTMWIELSSVCFRILNYRETILHNPYHNPSLNQLNAVNILAGTFRDTLCRESSYKCRTDVSIVVPPFFHVKFVLKWEVGL